jgi:hypothetical protein
VSRPSCSTAARKNDSLHQTGMQLEKPSCGISENVVISNASENTSSLTKEIKSDNCSSNLESQDCGEVFNATPRTNFGNGDTTSLSSEDGQQAQQQQKVVVHQQALESRSDFTKVQMSQSASSIQNPNLPRPLLGLQSSREVQLSMLQQSCPVQPWAPPLSRPTIYGTDSGGERYQVRSSSGPMNAEKYYPGGISSQATQLNKDHSSSQGANSANGYHSTAPSLVAKPDESRRQLMLRQQQQRLLLLRHAYKCPYTNGNCPVTRYCAGIKQLWSHISRCQDKTCSVPHCLSSRIILAHFHSCKDSNCAICEPVRSAIRQTMLKAQQMQYNQQSKIISQHYTHPNGQPQNWQRQYGQELHRSRYMSQTQNIDVSQQIDLPSKKQKLRAFDDGSNPYQHGQYDEGKSDTHEYARPSSKSVSKQESTAAPVLDAFTIPEDNALLLDFMTIEQIEAHLASLDSSNVYIRKKLKKFCLPLHKFLWDQPHGYWFHKRVDPIKMELPDYYDVIKDPMDLTIVRKRLDGNLYRDIASFEADIELIFSNAMLYNERGSDVHEVAKEMREKFKEKMTETKLQVSAEVERIRSSPNVCSLCLNGNLKFEPITYYCHGTSCSGRLRRNANYYCIKNEDYRWCMTCYQELSDDQPIDVGLTHTYKAHLEKRKNDEVNEEPWVHCDGCDRYVIK